MISGDGALHGGFTWIVMKKLGSKGDDKARLAEHSRAAPAMPAIPQEMRFDRNIRIAHAMSLG
jgi:hypothetical protein